MKRIMASVIVLLLVLTATGCGSEPAQEEHGHEHGDLPYEWSGELTLEPGAYEMVFLESGDPSMDIAFVLMDGSIEDLSHHAHHILEAETESVDGGETFQALPDYGYTLLLNPGETVFTFHIEEGGRYSLFTEHFPEEFGLQFFNEAGEQMIPENQQEHEE